MKIRFRLHFQFSHSINFQTSTAKVNLISSKNFRFSNDTLAKNNSNRKSSKFLQL